MGPDPIRCVAQHCSSSENWWYGVLEWCGYKNLRWIDVNLFDSCSWQVWARNHTWYYLDVPKVSIKNVPRVNWVLGFKCFVSLLLGPLQLFITLEKKKGLPNNSKKEWQKVTPDIRQYCIFFLNQRKSFLSVVKMPELQENKPRKTNLSSLVQ